MSCVCCFFDNEQQKELKEKCFGSRAFNEKLKQYEQLYLSELSELVSVADCSCNSSQRYINDQVYLQFTDDFLADLQAHTDEFGKMFDDLIRIFLLCRDGNLADAIQQADAYQELYCTKYSSKNAIQMCVPLFRARRSGNFDTSDIMQFFHFPLSNKEDAAEQRFSIQGSIMLYLARSIPTALNETGISISNAQFALFFPKYSWVYRNGLYSFQNSIDLTLNEAANNLMAYGVHFEYDNDRFTFSKKNLMLMMGDSILFQILSFPVECKCSPCDEYRLPQLFTTAWKVSPYLGIAYQSSKDTHLFSRLTKYSELDSNYCFFVPDCPDNYNLKLLDCFHHVCIGECASEVGLTDVSSALEQLSADIQVRKDVYNMTDYILTMEEIKRHLLSMDQVILHDGSYYSSVEGHVELSLFFELIEKIRNIVVDPDKHDICKWQELSR